MSKKIYCWHHSDLDGMGVKILAMLYAKEKGIEIETFKCNYGDINKSVMNILYSVPTDEIEEIIIGDISVNEEVATELDYWYKATGVPVILRDHHATATWLNKYHWAYVAEKDLFGKPKCGTYWLSQVDGLKNIYQKYQVFIDCINSWDTWLWKEENNLNAKKLNALFQVLGEKDFTDYILNEYSPFITGSLSLNRDSNALFNNYANAMVDAHERIVTKTANSCMKSMWDVDLSFKKGIYKTGVIFCNQDISDVADIILTKRPELDILLIIGFPRNISLRTRKNLDIKLGDLACNLTGAGGGHPQAAGAVISQSQFRIMFSELIRRSFDCGSRDVVFSSLKKYMEESDNE